MSGESLSRTNDSSDPAGRAAGVVIALASILSIAFMLHHPEPRARGMAEFIEAVRHIAVANAIVHGSLIACLGLLVVGFSYLPERLAPHSLVARAGLVAYTAGVIAMTAAALVSGFILPELVLAYQGRPHEAHETAAHLLGLCRAVNQVCSRVGVMAIAVAILFWSALLVRRTGFSLLMGGLGCAGALALIAGLLSGYLLMNVHGILSFVAVQAVWSVGVSAQMIRRRL
jgi:hypothetical protein